MDLCFEGIVQSSLELAAIVSNVAQHNGLCKRSIGKHGLFLGGFDFTLTR